VVDCKDARVYNNEDAATSEETIRADQATIRASPRKTPRKAMPDADACAAMEKDELDFCAGASHAMDGAPLARTPSRRGNQEPMMGDLFKTFGKSSYRRRAVECEDDGDDSGSDLDSGSDEDDYGSLGLYVDDDDVCRR
jgi:hypothetical protein